MQFVVCPLILFLIVSYDSMFSCVDITLWEVSEWVIVTVLVALDNVLPVTGLQAMPGTIFWGLPFLSLMYGIWSWYYVDFIFAMALVYRSIEVMSLNVDESW